MSKKKKKRKQIKMENKKEKENKLLLIPKTEQYMEYVLQMLLKLPRTEKFSIGNEYKTSIYQMIYYIMFLNKIDKKDKKEILHILNQIDALLNTQRIYLRILKNNRWIDEKKFKVAIEQIYEIGKILGGLMKYYAKNDSKSI